MKKKTFAAAALTIGLAGVALSACASRYSDGYYDRYGYYHSDRGYYADRDYRYDRAYRYDRDRDNDGVPNYADRRPDNPYRS